MQPVKRPNQSRFTQNNADLLLSVYELTARSSLQLAQRPRHQSHGRQYQEQGNSPDIQTITSPKKVLPQSVVSPQNSLLKPPQFNQSIAVSRRTNQKQPQLMLRQQQPVVVSPRYQTLMQDNILNKNAVQIIKSYIKSASDIIEGTSENHERLLRTYRYAKSNIESFVHRQEQNESSIESMQSTMNSQIEKFKSENESLKRRIQECNFEETTKVRTLLNTTTPIQSQVQSLTLTLAKMEKKAESRKICIKKLYQLLEKNERELELYRTGKKRSGKNSFIQQSDFVSKTQSLASKKSELNEILNTVYTRKNKGDSLESMLFTFVSNVDPKAYELIKQQTNNSQLSYDLDENNQEQEKLMIIQGCLKSIQNDVMGKQDAELALHNSLQYTLRLIEANQQIWRQALDKGCIDCMTFEPFIQFMEKQGYEQMVQDLQELEQKQNYMQEEIQEWLNVLNESQSIKRQNLYLTTKINDIMCKFGIDVPTDSTQCLDTINNFIGITLETYDMKVESSRKCVEVYEMKISTMEKSQQDHIIKQRQSMIEDHEESQLILQKQFNSLKQTYEDKLTKTSEQVDKKSKQEITELKTTLNGNYQQVFLLEQRIKDQEGQYLLQKQQLSDSNLHLNEQIVSLEQIQQELFNDNSTLQQRLQTVEHKNLYLKSLFEDKLLKFSQWSDKSNRDLTKQTTSIIQKLLSRIQTLQQKYVTISTQMKTKYQVLLKQIESGRITSEKTISDIKTELSTLDQKSRTQISVLEIELHEKKSSIILLHAEKQKQQVCITNLQNQSQIVEHQIERQQSNYQTCQANLDQLIKDNHLQGLQNTQLEAKVIEVTQTIIQLQIQLDEAINSKVRTLNDLHVSKSLSERQILSNTKQLQSQNETHLIKLDEMTSCHLIDVTRMNDLHQTQIQSIELEFTSLLDMITFNTESLEQLTHIHHARIVQNSIKNSEHNLHQLSQTDITHQHQSYATQLSNLENQIKSIQLHHTKLYQNFNQDLPTQLGRFQEFMADQQELFDKLNQTILHQEQQLKLKEDQHQHLTTSSREQTTLKIKQLEQEIQDLLVVNVRINNELIEANQVHVALQQEHSQTQQTNQQEYTLLNDMYFNLQRDHKDSNEKTKQDHLILNHNYQALQNDSLRLEEHHKSSYNDLYKIHTDMKQEHALLDEQNLLQQNEIINSRLVLQEQFNLLRDQDRIKGIQNQDLHQMNIVLQQDNDKLQMNNKNSQETYNEKLNDWQQVKSKLELDWVELNKTHMKLSQDYVEYQGHSDLEKVLLNQRYIVLQEEHSKLEQESKIQYEELRNTFLALQVNSLRVEEENKVEVDKLKKQYTTQLEDQVTRIEEESQVKIDLNKKYHDLKEKYCKLEEENKISYNDSHKQYLELVQCREESIMLQKDSELKLNDLNNKNIELMQSKANSSQLDEIKFDDLYKQYLELMEVRQKSIVKEEETKIQYNDLNISYLELVESKIKISKAEEESKLQFTNLHKQYLSLVDDNLSLSQKLDQMKSQEQKLISLDQQLKSDLKSISSSSVTKIEQLEQKVQDFDSLLEELNKTTSDCQQATAFCNSLENLLQELLFSRVNLTSIKNCLTDQQRDKLTDFRKKVGEIQTKIICSEKQQKVIDDCKFNLIQYQQIVDKSEMRASHFENECQKKDELLKEYQNIVDIRPSKKLRTVESYVEENVASENDQSDQQSYYQFLDFTLRDEVLYGDRSFFGDLSMIQISNQGKKDEIMQQLNNSLLMAQEDICELHRRLFDKL